MSERDFRPLIATAIASMLGTVAILSYYGYLHMAKPRMHCCWPSTPC